MRSSSFNQLVSTSFLLLSIGAVTSVYAEDSYQCVTPVQSFSNAGAMAKGDFTANIKWKEVTLKPTSLGFGPSEHHEYEISILDGKVYLTQPATGDKVKVRHDPKPNEGAAMLQVATPEAWVEYESLGAMANFDDYSLEIDQVIEDIECGDAVLMPFKIKGHATSVTWSMDTKEPRIVTSTDQEIVLVGLYN